MSTNYRVETLRNEYGSAYGVKYIICCKAEDFLNEQSRLIRDVIGEENYYSSRDVWDQIVIERKEG